MPVYPHHKAIFVHIPKTGGSTVTTMLKRKRFLWFGRDEEDPRGRGAETIFQLTSALGDDAAGYFKFAFVRNPWDRFVSAYHYIKQRRPGLEHVTCYASFGDFAAAFADDPDRYLAIRYFRPQWDYVCDASGCTPLDYLARFERFDEEMRHVLSEIGQARGRVRHRKRSRHGDYREYYDTASVEAVGEAYQAEIQRFGYQFEP